MSDHNDAQDYTANGPTDVGFRTGGDGTGITNGVVAAGTNVGVHGIGLGVDGSSALAIGVFGEVSGSSDVGVQGISRNGTGVFGSGDGTGGGVKGVSKGTGVTGDGDVSGVSGISHQNGIGVEGTSTSGPGVTGTSTSGPGVTGTSTSGPGVVGGSTSGVGSFFTSIFNDAVVARVGGKGDGVRANADSGIGVRGEAVAGIGIFGVSGKQAGVLGRSASSAGVFGFCDAPFQPFTPPVGVLGVNDKSVGVLGSSIAVIGVLGNTDKGLGVVGQANLGAGFPADHITDEGIAVIGLANSGIGIAGMSTSGAGVFGLSQTGLAGHFRGPVLIEGDLTVMGGNKSAAVPHPDGTHRQLYCMESPESWFEDFGEGRLVDGRGEVQLDPAFAALVELEGYHVFLTPYGESAGMFVAERYATGFRVHEQQGGASTVSFAYRVVAKRKDVVAGRLARVTLPKVSSGPELPDLRLQISTPDFDRLSVSTFDRPGSEKC